MAALRVGQRVRIVRDDLAASQGCSMVGMETVIVGVESMADDEVSVNCNCRTLYRLPIRRAGQERYGDGRGCACCLEPIIDDHDFAAELAAEHSINTEGVPA